ncbi:MAG TPA: site-2 protease family protein [Spirochaetia bacterium]|nr:site-2 protease family protein [Spirochaetia bacterium]
MPLIGNEQSGQDPFDPVQAGSIQIKVSAWKRWFLPVLALLYKLKFLLLFASVIITMVVYGLAFGWAFGAGIVVLILIHESGHLAAIKRRHMKASLPVLIPFLGAVIGLRQRPRDAKEEAFIGVAGPVFGIAASFLCWWLFFLTKDSVFLVLASFGFFMHVFNLMPVVPLDGGRTVAFLGWKAWVPGLAALLVLLFYNPLTHAVTVDPFTIIILAFILYNFRARLMEPPDPLYNQIALPAKWGFGMLWLFLLSLSIWGYLAVPLRVGI